MSIEIFKLKRIKILNKLNKYFFMNNNSLYIGFAEKALPPIILYSKNYKWEFTIFRVSLCFIISLKEF
jgi:hypothetical protein